MTKKTGILLTIAAFATGLMAADKKLAMKDLPTAVQKSVQDQAKGGEIKNIGLEKEKGVSQYEVETMLNGKHRDFEVDTKGSLLVMEEETSIDAIPAAAKAAILKKVGTGKVVMVETATKPGKEATYEASYTTKAGKKGEYAVTAAGVEIKED